MDEEPDVGILGIPYDLTSSHTPGARFGPDSIRRATDSERSHSYPLTLTDAYHGWNKALSSVLTLEDIGDLEVGVQLPESVAIHISDAASILSSSSSGLVFLGGDHFITYPVLRGVKRTRAEEIGLVYLDSHADFYDDMGGMTLSHASTLRRIVDDRLVAIENVVGFDLRCVTPDQRVELGDSVCPSDMTSLMKRIGELAKSVELLYVSVDLDVLTPTVSPAVSHPESGGLSISELVTIVDACFATRKVQYCDIVELNPMLDNARLSELAARDILKAILTGFAYHKEFK